MRWNKRPGNYCKRCGYQWSPRGHNVSRACPNCGSRQVAVPSAGLLGLVVICLALWFVYSFKDQSPVRAPSPGASTASDPLVQAQQAVAPAQPPPAPGEPAPKPPDPSADPPSPPPQPSPEEIAREEQGRSEREEENKKRAEIDARETAGLRLLNEAKSWEANGRTETAKAKYEELIEVYKGTKAAEEGKQRLDALKRK